MTPSEPEHQHRGPRRRSGPPLLLWGVLLVLAGMMMYATGVLMALPRRMLGLDGLLLSFNTGVVWYSGMPVLGGSILAAIDLFVLLPGKRRLTPVRVDPPGSRRLTVVLTAYNDEASIGSAVRDFLGHPAVVRVIVISNNSNDATMARAAEAGAIVHNEIRPGYGACVHRCLSEGLLYEDTELTLLCEGDCTFRAYDIDKFLAYIDHADIVNGTRIVEQLRQPTTQLTTYMYYGNLFVAKLLEAKHLGRGTFTDVGTTYKLCRNVSLRRLLPELDPSVNLEFNAHFLDRALATGEVVVECPITFHPRIGESKGGNVNNARALRVGTRMMRGIIFGWDGLRMPHTSDVAGP